MSQTFQPSTRPAAVAGLFYPGQPDELRRLLVALFADAKPGATAPKAVIVPHAGYVYSGAIAAKALARFAPVAADIERIVLLGPTHRVAVRGLAAPAVSAFETPLGPVPIDRAAIEAVRDLPQVTIDDRPHAAEHSLEVQLPLLQRVLPRFNLAPFAVGSATGGEVAAVLDRLWGGPETRTVISSDLSHYLGCDQAKVVDAVTASAIERFDSGPITFDHACGRLPVAGLLDCARRRGLAVERVELRNSGDTAGPRDRVVGYGAWAFH
ncbi:MAG: AmmeMemoRadiSam system protein B [Alphaproteobacteria bacterium]|nr:AmmeMemoRadiSam system protein B [Alphaproteobacteria bacterium]